MTTTSYTLLQSIGTGVIMWAGAAASPADALRRFYADVGHPKHTQQAIAAMGDEEIEALGDWLRSIEVPEALYQMMGGDKLDGARESTIQMLNAYANGQPVVAGPADFEPDQPNCAYVQVFAFDRSFNLKISRPRHPWRIGESMDSGAAILTDEGHNDNADFAEACSAAGKDFHAVAAYVIEKSDAEGALDAAERHSPSATR